MRTLEHRVHEAGATRLEEFAGGVAYFNDSLPAVWDANFVRLDRPCPEPAAEADRLQVRLGHRKVLVEDAGVAERVGPDLRTRGYAERRLVAMARAPGGQRDPAVRELPYDELRPLRGAILAEQLMPPDPAVIRQVTEVGALAERAGGRWLVVAEGDEPAGHCVVYSQDGLAQIEDVAMLDRHRRRGLARRLLLHALELVAPEHDTAFITADAGDWPAAFYGRLGFQEVERRSDFLLIMAS
jgi:ribosomal protein S18 acetylase RimI-like enzyme